MELNYDTTENETIEAAFGRYLADLLLEQEAGSAQTDERDFTVSRVETFAERGYLTRDEGLAIRLADGTKLDITIQHRRR